MCFTVTSPVGVEYMREHGIIRSLSMSPIVKKRPTFVHVLQRRQRCDESTADVNVDHAVVGGEAARLAKKHQSEMLPITFRPENK